MRTETKQKIQLALVIAFLVAGTRTALIFYERHAPEKSAQAPPLDPDYYVVPKKLYAYDLKTARQLTEQPVWVKEGYRYTYYPYRQGRTDFSHEAGQLLPLEELRIKDVVTDVTPGARDERQIMAVFDADGKTYAFPFGSVKQGNYRIYSDEMLYIQDPHQLYKHWPPEVWQTIDQHQVMPGMNELQVDFAIGGGVPEGTGVSDVKTVDYPNGGKPLRITFRNGKAAEIQPGSDHG
ncbi:MAG TPA: hypothetical protein VEI52_04085 [Terriglobales bacterium]|nr:hypothetical protein [Terriglobales bacterium]